MGTFRRHDCPYIMDNDKKWCKLKATEIINRADTTPDEKFHLLRKMTCHGCDIYKDIKNKEKVAKRNAASQNADNKS